jgi:uncharacterized protein YndB with AHSA1/START domain
MTGGTTTRTVVREIEIRAPLARVYAALTDPDQIRAWWGADAYRCEKVEADFRVGGKWRTTGHLQDGKPFAVEGEYRRIDVPRLVEMTWRHDWGDRPEEETVVRYELMEQHGVTRVRVTHSGFVDEKGRDDHGDGWARVLTWLQGYVQSA